MLKYKWNPFDIGDIEYTESWLGDLAARGLVLTGCFGRFFKFEKTEPREWRFRLEPVGDGSVQPDDELCGLYSDFGWEYVDTYGSKYYIFKTADKHAAEPHTDPEIQRHALKKALGSSLWPILYLALLSLFALGMVLFIIFRGDSPLLNVIKGGSEKLIYVFVLMVMSIISEFLRFRRLLAFKKRLKTGEVDHRIKYRRVAVLSKIITAVTLILSIGWFAILLSRPFDSSFDVLDEYNEPLPFPMLDSIETASGDSGWVTRDDDLLAPVQIELVQRDDYGETPVYYSVEYYEFIYEPLAARAYTELEKGVLTQNDCEAAQISQPGADEAAYYTCADGQFLLIRCGVCVTKIYYEGENSLRDYAGQYVK